MKVKSESEVNQSCPTLAIPWTVAHQAPPSMGFSRQKYWSGAPLPSPFDQLAYTKCHQDTVAGTSTGQTKHQARRVGELRFITLAGPEELSSEPGTKRLQSFYRQIIVCNTNCYRLV